MRSRARWTLLLTAATVSVLALSAAYVASGERSTSGPATAEAATPRYPLLNGFNAARRLAGSPPLRVLRVLNRSSRRAAGVMATAQSFRHVGPPHRPRMRVRGEIIGFRYGWHRGRAAARWVLTQWLRSPTHRGVITYRRFRYVGAARVHGYLNGRRATFWVAHFGG